MTDSTPHRVTEIEEVVTQAGMLLTQFQLNIAKGNAAGATDHFEDFLRTKLTTLVAEAEARGRQQAVEYMYKKFPNSGNDGFVVHRHTLEAARSNHTA